MAEFADFVTSAVFLRGADTTTTTTEKVFLEIAREYPDVMLWLSTLTRSGKRSRGSLIATLVKNWPSVQSKRVLTYQSPDFFYPPNQSFPSPHGTELDQLQFVNRVLQALPVDKKQNTPRAVPNAIFSLVEPTPVTNPSVVATSASALRLLDIDAPFVQEQDEKRFAELFSGCVVFEGARPAAHCYCGHQFGYFSGQLGDGATMYVGEIRIASGHYFELQFKGAGKTPFSRTADGRKVLRSSIREFLCSEHMHALNIPTTRSGSVVTSDSKVVRDIFYSGNPIEERCTIITRMAPTFLRFGSFEIARDTDSMTHRAGPSAGNTDLLRQLADFTIATYYPHIDMDSKERYAVWFEEVVDRTASLVAKWQASGWCHGVLNTDNMSIIGLTIDYGPFGFMEHFNKDFVCNLSDNEGRYSYAKQPEMCAWNCQVLADSLAPLLPSTVSKPIVATFHERFLAYYLSAMRKKLGLRAFEEEDETLVAEWFAMLHECRIDFTNAFVALERMNMDDGSGLEHTLDALMAQRVSLAKWASDMRPRFSKHQLEQIKLFLRLDPGRLPSGLDDAFVAAEEAKADRYEELIGMGPEVKLAKDSARARAWLETYDARLTRERDAGHTQVTRVALMQQVNPTVVLRNWLAQRAIAQAEQGDYSGVENLLQRCMTPFQRSNNECVDDYTSAAPEDSDFQGVS